MNLREGTRRLALVLGMVGAIPGGFASYAKLQTVLSQRTRHNTFERLANSDVAQQERKELQTPIDLSAGLVPSPGATHLQPTARKSDKATKHGPWERYAHADVQPTAGPQVDLSTAGTISSTVNKAGIGTINWGHDYRVDSIETQDGQTFSSTPAPSAWLYLLIAFFPVLGFFVPWGAIRAAGWVVAGFVNPAV